MSYEELPSQMATATLNSEPIIPNQDKNVALAALMVRNEAEAEWTGRAVIKGKVEPTARSAGKGGASSGPRYGSISGE
jgi:hypothetical protein